MSLVKVGFGVQGFGRKFRVGSEIQGSFHVPV